MNTTQQSKVTTIATTVTTSNDIKKLDCVTTQLHFLQLPLGNFWRPFFLLTLVSLLGGRQREKVVVVCCLFGAVAVCGCSKARVDLRSRVFPFLLIAQLP